LTFGVLQQQLPAFKTGRDRQNKKALFGAAWLALIWLTMLDPSPDRCATNSHKPQHNSYYNPKTGYYAIANLKIISRI
jgi:hypothetical protein